MVTEIAGSPRMGRADHPRPDGTRHDDRQPRRRPPRRPQPQAHAHRRTRRARDRAALARADRAVDLRRSPFFVFATGLVSSVLSPTIQTRLMDVAGDNQSIAAALNHSALNIGNALGAFLGGVVIAIGWGFVAPAWVGVVLALGGLGDRGVEPRCSSARAALALVPTRALESPQPRHGRRAPLPGLEWADAGAVVVRRPGAPRPRRRRRRRQAADRRPTSRIPTSRSPRPSCCCATATDGPEVLMIERPDRGSFAGRVGLPGRQARPDDDGPIGDATAPEEADARRAAVRETREETGLELDGIRSRRPSRAGTRRPGCRCGSAPGSSSARRRPGELRLEPRRGGRGGVAAAGRRPASARHGASSTLYPPTWVTLHGLAEASRRRRRCSRLRGSRGLRTLRDAGAARARVGPVLLLGEDAEYDGRPAGTRHPAPAIGWKSARLPGSTRAATERVSGGARAAGARARRPRGSR